VRVGLKTTNQIQARKIQVDGDTITFVLKIYQNRYPITLTHVHEGRIANVLTATGIAHLIGIADDVIVRAVQQPLHVPGRFEYCVMKNGHGLLINDTYNANPESVKAALIAFEHIDTDAKKIVLLGDMCGLGLNAPFWHRQIGRFLRKIPSIEQLILIGKDVNWVKKTAPIGLTVRIVANWKEANELLATLLNSDALVLVKGSRSLHLENVVNNFVTHEQASERNRIWHQ
jgi:UDP-N-acetylmuramoyl-tripeptide--D-alanyl-D-alanine ligase